MTNPVTHVGIVETSRPPGGVSIPILRKGPKHTCSFNSFFRDFVGKKIRITIEEVADG